MATQESGETPETPSVNLREVWPNETSDFTPWLAENLHLLGDALDMKLRLIQSEAYGYGGFTDILAESDEHERVVIENQLEPSDNDHFIRLMGYAADHKASALVWVAPRFWEYHQRLLGWLREAMDGNRKIFAVELQLVPGDELHRADGDQTTSGYSPEFSQVALHNNWPEWSELTTYRDSDARQRYRDFFQTIIGELRRRGMTDQVNAPARNDHGFPSGFEGISYRVGFWGGSDNPRLDVYLWIATGGQDRNKEIFDALYQHREDIKVQLGGVTWDRRNNQRMCSIYFSRSGSIGDPEQELAALQEWASDRLAALRDEFQPRLEVVMKALGTD